MIYKNYLIKEVGVGGYGSTLIILKGKYVGVELTSYHTTPVEFEKKGRTIESCIKLAHRENKKITIAIYEDLLK